MSIIPPTGSRFNKSVPIVYDGKETWGRPELPTYLTNPTEDQIIKYHVNGAMAGRPDKISDDIYGTHIYDWVLLMVNNVMDPLDWPERGETILAIKKDILFLDFGN